MKKLKLTAAFANYNPVRCLSTQFLLALFCLLSWFSSKAQAYLPGAYNMNFVQWTPFPDYNQIRESRLTNQKWFVTKYLSVSAGTAFYPGGGATYVSAPIGLQINRQITNNLYGFGGVYLAPTFSSFSSSFLNPSINKSYPGYMPNQYNLTVNPGIQAGLMYVNDAGTFSISGSVHMQRSSYPVYYSAPTNTKRR